MMRRVTIVRRTLAQYAYDELRTLIIAGELRPGDQVVVRPLCERLSLSPTPIKSALAALGRDGFLVADAYRGFFVPELSLRDIQEIYEIREALDAAASRKVARREDSAVFVASVLEPLLEAQRADWNRNDVAAYRDADVEFHRAIWRASGNERLARVTDNLGGQVRLGWAAQLSDRVPQALEEHRAIMEALSAGDTRAAEAASRAHVRRSVRAYEIAFKNRRTAK